MNQTTKILFCILLLCLVYNFQLFSQIYVDQNATAGNKNGATWENAFLTIEAAVAAAARNEEIWVKQGKYILKEPLTINGNGTKIYGSFTGNENSPTDRDFSQWTILSGDTNQDDVDGVFDQNKTDNVHIVLDIGGNDELTYIADGFIIEGGRGDLEGGFGNFRSKSGGIYVFGSVTVRNCIIQKNNAQYGGGMYIDRYNDFETEVIVENCIFRDNEAPSVGGGVFGGVSGTKYSFSNSRFERNKALQGGALASSGQNEITSASVENCYFVNNEATLGGAIVAGSTLALDLSGCRFENNQAYEGGSIYAVSDPMITMGKCEFSQNKCTYQAAVLYLSGSTTAYLTDCIISENIGENTGAITLWGSSSLQIKSSIFEKNLTNLKSGFAGSVFAGPNTSCMIKESTFSENESLVGGAVYFDHSFKGGIYDCDFSKNKSEEIAAIAIRGITVPIINSNFIQNQAAYFGTVGVFEGGSIEVENCLFHANTLTHGWGGAMNIDGKGKQKNIVKNSIFKNNQSDFSAGAIYHIDSELEIINSVFHDNIAVGGGVGNSISTNMSEGNADTVKILHCTFDEAAGGLGSITPWSDSESKGILVLANNIFAGAGPTIEIEDGNAEIISQGSNLSHQIESTFLNHSSDIYGKDPKFRSSKNSIYTLSSDSPCIDAGQPISYISTDIEGNPRDDRPDIGAYEASSTTSAYAQQTLSGSLTLLGNPVVTELNANFRSNANGTVNIQIISISGQKVYSEIQNKNSEIVDINIGVQHLSTGIYTIFIEMDQKKLSKRFIKAR